LSAKLIIRVAVLHVQVFLLTEDHHMPDDSIEPNPAQCVEWWSLYGRADHQQITAQNLRISAPAIETVLD